MTTHPLGGIASDKEAVGTLHGMAVEEGILIAQISKVRLALPVEMETKLQPLIGERIGIHTDIKGKDKPPPEPGNAEHPPTQDECLSDPALIGLA